MEEYIGKVKLDMTYYSGKDLYCDGDSEDLLLEIVKKHTQAEYNQLIFDHKSWPIMYHLSGARANIVDWVDIKESDSVLEIGAGCGAITWKLAEKAGSVTSIDLSKKRSTINAYRNKDKANLNLVIGNFEDIVIEETYDVITLIGVLEYANLYLHGENAYVAMLKKIRNNLRKDGKLLIAIENRFGLKYWSGCKEDHIGEYFTGLEGYPYKKDIQTFTKKELERILKEANFNNYKFYYPYPDYKFMSSLYSDEYLPQKNELTNNIRNFDTERLELFNETNVYKGLLENDLFTQFSNSFMVVIENGNDNG